MKKGLTLSEVQTEIAKIIKEDGIALIPVPNDREDRKPYVKWASYSIPKLSSTELFDIMANKNTQSVACILGVRSGGLICIDIDTKHNKGFDAEFFKSCSELYPDIWKRFRVEQTPSGGYHLYYRLSEFRSDGVTKWTKDNFPKSFDAASRLPTEEEVLNRPDVKTKCFIEIKAEGNFLCHCFPSVGYSKVRDCEEVGNKERIGILSEDEHNSIMKLCRLYDEVKKEEKVATRVSEEYSSIYNEGDTPIDCYNKSLDGATILEGEGWVMYKQSGDYDWYKKPSRKENDKHIDATFDRVRKFYRIFTTATEFEAKKFSPSGLLCFLKFNSKWKELFQYLVAQGYGVIKPSIEERIIKKAAKYGKELPANISEQGVEKYELEVQGKGAQYPYGIFWGELPEGGYKISRQLFYNVSKELGFRNHKENICVIEDYKIRIIKDYEYFDTMKSYIAKEESLDLFDTFEAFLQNSGKFSILRLEKLDVALVLRSTKQISYKFFENCYVCVKPDCEIEILDYKNLNQLIFDEDVKKRPFTLISEGLQESLYYRYLENAVGIDDYLMKCIGYYIHEHRDEEGYFCIATEKCENPSDGGGSGKNIFWNLLGLITTLKSTPASMVSLSTNLLQSWSGEKIFSLSDMPKGFDIIFFKDLITGNATVNKKYINEFSVDIQDMCKIGGSSNYSFDDTDPGIKRRVRPIEFTDYYTLLGGVKKVHGKMFPKEWSQLDYLHFDNIMLLCIKKYLESDNIIEKKNLSEGGWTKQFEQQYNAVTKSFIDQYIEIWCDIEEVKINEVFNIHYESFCRENKINQKYVLSSTKMNNALSSYCAHFGIEFIKIKNVGREALTNQQVNAKVFKRKVNRNSEIEELEFQQVSALDMDEDAPF